MRRILSVWLPSWQTQRLRRRDLSHAPGDEASGEGIPPLATAESVRGMRRLAAVCPQAASLGLRPEQALSEARAMCPDLVVVDADPAAELAALTRLAAWCERYTPLAATCPPDGLWLDITGCSHFFDGGEAGLAADLHARLARSRLEGRIGIASATGAAWAVARSATARGDWTVVAPGQEQPALNALPVGLLRLDARTVAGLRRVGLRSIGEMTRLPRGELAGRYGTGTLTRLDQAFGRAAEAIVWPHPPPPWDERVAFAEPIGTADDLGRALDLLAQRLCARLEKKSVGAKGFAATFFRVDDLRPRIAISTALPVRDPGYVARLLRAKLESVDPGFGVDAVALEAADVLAAATPQGRLGDLAIPAETALAASVDDLANRMGHEAIWRAAPRESRIPERAVRRLPPLDRPVAWTDDPSRPRPVRLLRRPEAIEVVALVPDDPPIMFRWRGSSRRVRAAEGPERIAPEWWERRRDAADGDGEPVRDYYRVEDTKGARFWIYRAGLMGDAKPPVWYLHGFFG